MAPRGSKTRSEAEACAHEPAADAEEPADFGGSDSPPDEGADASDGSAGDDMAMGCDGSGTEAASLADPSVAVARAKVRSPKKAAQKPVAASSSGPSLHKCTLCLEPIVDADELVFAGASTVAYHCNCLGAIRYFERQCSRTPADKATLEKFKREKPTDYRYKCLELRTEKLDGGHKRRGAEERAKCMSLVEEVRFFATSYRQQYILMLGRRAFIAWCPGVTVMSESGVGKGFATQPKVSHVVARSMRRMGSLNPQVV